MGPAISKCIPNLNDFPSIPRTFVFGAPPFEGFTVYLDVIAFATTDEIIESARHELIRKLTKYNLLTLVEVAESLQLELTEEIGVIEDERTPGDEIVIYAQE